MQIHWTADYDMRGNGYGYTMHQKNLRAALEAQGVEMTPDAHVAVHILTPPSFNPIEGKYNILYTMYEMQALPDEWIEPIQGADLIIVPNEHNRRLFSRYTDRPIEVVWEGVHPDKFSLVKRERPTDKRFRFLWLGASNPRKGYEQVCVAWERLLKEYPDIRGKVELYLKTTQPMNELRNMNIMGAYAIFDNRDVDLDELIGLYHSAHCFLFPSMGEGWGLTLHEAMATGLPAIYTPWSAMRDWVPEKYAYALRYQLKEIETVGLQTGATYHKALAAWPDIDHLKRRMYQVWSRYEEAAERGYHGAQVVRGLTWGRSAEEFIAKIGRHVELEAAA